MQAVAVHHKFLAAGGIKYAVIIKFRLPILFRHWSVYRGGRSQQFFLPQRKPKAAKAVANGECEKGVVVCGTGIGVSITCNKVKGIRCALVHDVFSAKATRAHNDTNMLAMGQRVIGEGLALEILNAWLHTDYEGGRHDQRIAKMMALESE